VINIESEVFNTVATALRSEFTGIFVSGESIAAPSSFPAVTLVEQDNSTYQRSLDSSGSEKHAVVTYEANAYSNLVSGKKKQTRAIMAIIDDEMQDMGFVRIGSSPAEVPNADKTIYRMVARYRATISTDKIIYRR
jgi:hypothetical protein